ncbi:MAG: hypothetical protein GDA38_07885 [Hormoscilla sp. SP12CHS1]|nr:hypothetical protein [Hormoscilla sp. SP12CHS1]
MSIPVKVQRRTIFNDLEGVKEITQLIVGETCWRAIMSYGDELVLHAGARIPYSQKSMVGKEKGSWILGTKITEWQLECKGEMLFSSQSLPEMRDEIHVIEGTKITAFEISTELGLTVEFSNGCQLKLFPNEQDDSDLPYYELFTPDRMVLKVGKGASLSYLPSDLPESN